MIITKRTTTLFKALLAVSSGYMVLASKGDMIVFCGVLTVLFTGMAVHSFCNPLKSSHN